MLEISDENERRALKDVMKNTLLPFYQKTEEAYGALEARLVETKTERLSRYEILTGLADRRKVDITEEAMVPMRYTDMQDFMVDIDEMAESLEEQKPYKVMQLFVRADMKTIQRMKTEKRYYRGVVYAKGMEFPGTFQLVWNDSYINQVEELYPVFEKNGLEWNTVCMPYLFKFFDVEIVKTQCQMDVEIEKIVVDFEEYKQYIDYNVIPMWNVRILESHTGVYPDFAIDRIHYEHCVFKEQFVENRDYLIESKDTKIWDIFRQNGDIHIICDSEVPLRWMLIELGYDALRHEYDEIVFGNYHRRTNKRCIHTYAEVKRFISELGYDNYVQLTDIKYWGQKEKSAQQSYSMNVFLDDEIRISKQRPAMLFTFKAKEEAFYLNEDIMSYLVSAVQWELPEFECIGELS